MNMAYFSEIGREWGFNYSTKSVKYKFKEDSIRL